jgi:hypothetical protein
VGWYLMAAPSHPNQGIFDTHAPLSRWQWRASFDTASDCMRGRAARIERLGRFNTVFGTVGGSVSVDLIYICVSSDDPRLKEK